MKEVDPKGDGGPLDGCGTRLLIIIIIALIVSCAELFSPSNIDLHKKALQGDLLPDSTEAKQ